MNKYLIILAVLLIIPLVKAQEYCNETNITEDYCTKYCNQNNTTNILLEDHCNISLSLETEKYNYKNGDMIKIYNKLSNKSYDFIIDYWIEDEKGNIVKEKISTTNTNPKQFTPKFTDNTTLIIKNNLTSLACPNTNNNTYNEVRVFVEAKKDPNSNFTIEKIYLNRSKKIGIGNNLTASISAYSGNNTNYTITSLIENLTNETNYTLIGEFNYSVFNITTPIPYDCNLKTNNYTFIVKSEEKELKQNLTIINNCQNNTNINKTIEQKQNNTETEIVITQNETNSSESVINLEGNSLTGRTIYESTNIKAKKIAIYFFMVILAAITIILIITNKNTNKVLKESTEKWSSQLEQ